MTSTMMHNLRWHEVRKELFTHFFFYYFICISYYMHWWDCIYRCIQFFKWAQFRLKSRNQNDKFEIEGQFWKRCNIIDCVLYVLWYQSLIFLHIGKNVFFIGWNKPPFLSKAHRSAVKAAPWEKPKIPSKGPNSSNAADTVSIDFSSPLQCSVTSWELNVSFSVLKYHDLCSSKLLTVSLLGITVAGIRWGALI